MEYIANIGQADDLDFRRGTFGEGQGHYSVTVGEQFGRVAILIANVCKVGGGGTDSRRNPAAV